MANLFDGKALRRKLNTTLKAKVESMPRAPSLAVVLVGVDPASQVYVRMKGKVAERIGFTHRQIDLPNDATQAQVEEVVAELDADASVDGILVQLPLPKHLDERPVLAHIRPAKDVDGLLTANAGLLAHGRGFLIPCTPLGVMRLLQDAQIELSGLDAVVVGRSILVGRPMAMLLEQANCTVTVCHSRTRDLAAHVGRADLVVAAVGRPEFVKGDWIKPGAVVIDVGINRLDDGRLVGDVAFDSARERASWITPVPGGVGPMTIAMLMENTWRASCKAQGIDPSTLR